MAPLIILIRIPGTGAIHLNPRDKIGHGRGPSRSEVSKGMTRVNSRRMGQIIPKARVFILASGSTVGKTSQCLKRSRIPEDKGILRHDGAAAGTVLRSERAASNYWRLSRHASCMYLLAWPGCSLYLLFSLLAS